MLKYLSGLFTGVLLGAITYSVLVAYEVSRHPEMGSEVYRVYYGMYPLRTIKRLFECYLSSL